MLCLSAALMLSGCGDDLNLGDAVGIFQSNHGHGVEVLDIRPDGTYVLTYQKVDSTVFTNSSRWTFEKDKDGVASMSFYYFRFGYTDSPPPFGDRIGILHVDIERSFWGTPEMIVDPDLGYAYVK
ncbi:hypothetical protein GOZ78_17730 [Agrobacterium vitis]|uniref:Lipoprotein n=1 Tax=Agrobacterium vitis TaxID=373 RepID=A0ABD6G9W9_AGRVI|nr:hypothetical protein [Agrobacterium vitis]MUO79434.1 hypothetical protein [Agrobacterium vitis]MUO96259.1 hypothetical protein [Agrobacterium vitis]MUP05676.1 hypothetical protein [Agrobacterium vitis]MUZ82760.1 hypothetical protein [Agrobacterium vitis]MVA11864.1 hypothetical protein [Agrobacterium vitis]